MTVQTQLGASFLRQPGCGFATWTGGGSGYGGTFTSQTGIVGGYITLTAPGGGSRVLMMGGMSGYSNIANSYAWTYLEFNGTSVQTGNFMVDTVSCHEWLGTGMYVFPGPYPAGSYYCTLNLASNDGIILDSNDWSTVTAVEIP